ncbi:hypothetical protein [Burkholderia diffusa]|uniref:hypothetical protein n=1 Tax=Burkholderia diffusa TaxID=488732 RepID=UPI0020C72319|nr:hypothetical protein [Burkholderia diffusa]
MSSSTSGITVSAIAAALPPAAIDADTFCLAPLPIAMSSVDMLPLGLATQTFPPFASGVPTNVCACATPQADDFLFLR